MDSNILTIVYHNSYGKRNRMTVDLERFFPCGRDWLDKLIKYVIRGSDDPEEHLQQITAYLEEQYNTARRQNKIESTPKGRKAERLNKSCLELLGGKYGQHYNIDTK